MIKEQIHVTRLVCSQNSSSSELPKPRSPRVAGQQLLAVLHVPVPRCTPALIHSPNRAS